MKRVGDKTFPVNGRRGVQSPFSNSAPTSSFPLSIIRIWKNDEGRIERLHQESLVLPPIGLVFVSRVAFSTSSLLLPYTISTRSETPLNQDGMRGIKE